jgi:DNA-binding NarL/FixJ family response regulator
MPKSKRRRILFVDDHKRVHEYSRKAARGHSQWHAFNPKQARELIKDRITAIEQLRGIKLKQRAQEKNRSRKAVLTRQINSLERMKRSPFDVVVSDINMPSGKPTGMPLLKELRKTFPQMRVIMHSDDKRNLKRAKRQGAKALLKPSFVYPGELEAIVRAALIREVEPEKVKRWLKKLDKEAKRHPIRNSLAGLKIPNEAITYATLLVVSTEPSKRKQWKKRLFDFVLAGKLKPNTYKAILRCRWPLPDSIIYTLDKRGRVTELKR